MFCNGCGQALVAGQGFCPRCGRASGMGMPMRPVGRVVLPLSIVERRVNALAIGWLVYGAIAGVFGLIGLAFAHAFWAGHGYSHFDGPGYGHRFFRGPEWPLIALRFGRIALAVKVGLALAAGVGLLQKASWGRWVAVVAACFALLSFPFGTAVGIWSLVVLLSAPNAAGYEAMAR